MKLPRPFFQPLAIGAPAPLRELPVRLERMIHFVPPHIEKVTARVPDPVPGWRALRRVQPRRPAIPKRRPLSSLGLSFLFRGRKLRHGCLGKSYDR